MHEQTFLSGWSGPSKRAAFVILLALTGGTGVAQGGEGVFIVGPDGDAVAIEANGVGGPPLLVLDSDGRMLSSTGPDCTVTANRPQCRTLQYLQGVDRDKQEQAPGVVIVTQPGAVLLTDAQSSVHPPPVIIVEGIGVVNCYALIGDFDCN